VAAGNPPAAYTFCRVKTDYFGEAVAARYDGGPMFSPEVLDPAVDFLAKLAGEGPALEFGIGTGRVALPLAQRGIRVHGIDLSEAMVGKLRAKPGAELVGTTLGDFASTRVEGTYSLVYLVFNTIGNLTTQDDQVACFQNAADHLAPSGRFVIEVGTPDLQRLSPGERFYPFDVSGEHVGFDEYDVANQGLVSHHFSSESGAWRRESIPFRYVWPAELDLMARLAGMRLRERWENWDRSPFTSESRKHISVWERPA
jgi:SAM-dependent methyltransferase